MTRDGKRSILLLNGPNLNLLGTREPQIYGSETLDDVVTNARQQVEGSSHHFDAFQSNWEGALIDRVHAARTDGTDAIVINPAAYTHTSVALRDAILGVGIPFIEIHISNVHSREKFRHHSYFSDAAVAVMMGFGVKGYQHALDFALNNTAKFPPRPEPKGAVA